MDDANKFMTAVGRSVGKPYGLRPRVISTHTGIGSQPSLQQLSASGTAGFDAGARAAGLTFLPSGTPRRYGKYFGIKPPGASSY